jgi:large subunit ribosomal protein L29e
VLILCVPSSIKKPKTSRYPSLKGTDPKFRRNHRHALHGTMKALVGFERRLYIYWKVADIMQKELKEGKRETA